MRELFDSELKVMEALWDYGPQKAVELVKRMGELYSWNKNTTYTVIKKLIDKGAIARSEPGFMCTPLVTREEIQKREMNRLIDHLFRGSKAKFLASFFSNYNLTEEEAQRLRELIDNMEVRRDV